MEQKADRKFYIPNRPPINLWSLLKVAGLTKGRGPDPMIGGLSYDSRDLQPGDLFFALQGHTVDGHDFISQAEKKGVAAVVGEKTVPCRLPFFISPHIMATMSKMAHAFYGAPSQKINVVGITGTNGKTTITYLLEKILGVAGRSAGVMGTINYRFGNESLPAPNTTPMSIDVQQFLSYAVQKNAFAVVMEVSSHALELHRVDDVHFTTGIFTNLTQDHLDFHKTMENYFQAKAKLFHNYQNIKPVINIDDKYGRTLAAELKTAITFGFDNKAMVRAENPILSLGGTVFDLVLPTGRKRQIKNSLMGYHNISNMMASAGAALTLGLKEDDLCQGLEACQSVPGRLERVENDKGFVVVVDYAHTPDALTKAIQTLKEIRPKRLVCVFGAGGDRDRTKRPIMGQIAVQNADFVFVTSDNPRTEDPTKILQDIEAGMLAVGKTNYKIIEDRDMAIGESIRFARPGDIILIAGKGHENYQIYGHEKRPFSDQSSALKALEKWN